MNRAVRYQQTHAWLEQAPYAEPPFDLRYGHLRAPAHRRDLQLRPVATPSRRRKPFSWFQTAVQAFVLCALAFGCLQITRAIVSHLYQISVLTANAGVMNRLYRETIDERALLTHKIAVYSSPAGVEELARNNLDMVGPDETLVRLRP
ncbi:MAG: hypothetical protein IPK79_12435 [Vampirovibrionales bacterium]|nr:hypothetical protein [Vampirovibrionales bacterium]